jgi:uncharacterized protein involved in exopolysaccharide biosynthesis
MSAGTIGPDLGAEREVDLRRWRDAVLARRWFLIAGLVGGLIVGGLYSLSGASAWEGTVTIQPAQPFNSAGNPVLNYTSSPVAIELLVTSARAIQIAAAAAHMSPDQLEGHVTTSDVITSFGPVATRGTVLISITVTLPQEVRTVKAANALGRYVVDATEGPYVRTQINVYNQRTVSENEQLASVTSLINAYQNTLKNTKLPAFEQLVLTSELDDAETRQGTVDLQMTSNEAALTLAKSIELAQIINPAAAVKVTSRTHRNSILFGGLIGLIVGGLVALVIGLRSPRFRSST